MTCIDLQNPFVKISPHSLTQIEIMHIYTFLYVKEKFCLSV